MPEEIRRIEYWYAVVPDKPGEGARILSALSQAGVNLLALSGFPAGARKAQIDLFPEDAKALAAAARKAGIKLSKKKVGFLIQGDDRPGAVAETLTKLAAAGINCTSIQAACAGAGRYGAMLWVKAPDVKKTAKVLGIA